MTQIISFLLSVVFAIDMFFIGLFPEKQLVITQTETETEYYVDGESDSLRFGVAGDGNLFEPDDEIRVVIECLDDSLDGTKTKISVRSEQTGFDKRGYITLDSSLPYNTFTFSSDKNGIFTVAIKLPDTTEYTANGKKIEVYYSLGKKAKIAAPEGYYKAFDMYGNEIEIDRKLTVSNSPIYIVY